MAAESRWASGSRSGVVSSDIAPPPPFPATPTSPAVAADAASDVSDGFFGGSASGFAVVAGAGDGDGVDLVNPASSVCNYPSQPRAVNMHDRFLMLPHVNLDSDTDAEPETDASADADDEPLLSADGRYRWDPTQRAWLWHTPDGAHRSNQSVGFLAVPAAAAAPVTPRGDAGAGVSGEVQQAEAAAPAPVLCEASAPPTSAPLAALQSMASVSSSSVPAATAEPVDPLTASTVDTAGDGAAAAEDGEAEAEAVAAGEHEWDDVRQEWVWVPAPEASAEVPAAEVAPVAVAVHEAGGVPPAEAGGDEEAKGKYEWCDETNGWVWHPAPDETPYEGDASAGRWVWSDVANEWMWVWASDDGEQNSSAAAAAAVDGAPRVASDYDCTPSPSGSGGGVVVEAAAAALAPVDGAGLGACGSDFTPTDSEEEGWLAAEAEAEAAAVDNHYVATPSPAVAPASVAPLQDQGSQGAAGWDEGSFAPAPSLDGPFEDPAAVAAAQHPQQQRSPPHPTSCWNVSEQGSEPYGPVPSVDTLYRRDSGGVVAAAAAAAAAAVPPLPPLPPPSPAVAAVEVEIPPPPLSAGRRGSAPLTPMSPVGPTGFRSQQRELREQEEEQQAASTELSPGPSFAGSDTVPVLRGVAAAQPPPRPPPSSASSRSEQQRAERVAHNTAMREHVGGLINKWEAKSRSARERCRSASREPSPASSPARPQIPLALARSPSFGATSSPVDATVSPVRSVALASAIDELRLEVQQHRETSVRLEEQLRRMEEHLAAATPPTPAALEAPPTPTPTPTQVQPPVASPPPTPPAYVSAALAPSPALRPPQEVAQQPQPQPQPRGGVSEEVRGVVVVPIVARTAHGGVGGAADSPQLSPQVPHYVQFPPPPPGTPTGTVAAMVTSFEQDVCTRAPPPLHQPTATVTALPPPSSQQQGNHGLHDSSDGSAAAHAAAHSHGYNRPAAGLPTDGGAGSATKEVTPRKPSTSPPGSKSFYGGDGYNPWASQRYKHSKMHQSNGSIY